MAVDDRSWKTLTDGNQAFGARHQAKKIKSRKQIGEQAESVDPVFWRLPLKGKGGSIDLIEIDGIFYLEALGEKILIRTQRKKSYQSVQRLGELAKKLPAPVFVRCHRGWGQS